MEKEINIAELLKDAPKGLRLWSTIHGNIIFQENIDDIICKTDRPYDNEQLQFDKYGHWLYGNWNNRALFSESVVLFPSQENYAWSTFKAPWKHKHFEPFQKVLIKTTLGEKIYWVADIFSNYDKDTSKYSTIGGLYLLDEDDIIPYKGNEDLVGKECK